MASKKKKNQVDPPIGTNDFKNYWFILPALVVLVFSLWLKSYAIQNMSPTFDEPFHLIQAVSLKQSGELFQKDVHGPAFPFFLSMFISRVGNFENVKTFSEDKKKFNGPYQYMLDEFSGQLGDLAIQSLRWYCQTPWILAVFALCGILILLHFNVWHVFLIYSWLLLDPALQGITSTVSNDVFMMAMGTIGMFFVLLNKSYAKELALLFFFLSWLTKFNAYLFLFPALVISLRKQERSWKPIFICLGAGILAFMSIIAFNWADISAQSAPSNYRLTYLSNVISLRPLSYYFLQVSLLKTSVCALFILALAIFFYFKNKLYTSWQLPVLLGFAFLSAAWWLPGLGFRLVLIIHITTMVLALMILPNFRKLGLFILIFVALIGVESFYNKENYLSFQNPLAGNEPRSLDSNTDWGQALKDLVEWRRTHTDGNLALSLFGGTMPEIYGLDDYFKLPSFPELNGGEEIEGGQFSGFVAVSKNFLGGYVIDNYALKILKNKKPIKCFQQALCLFDVRENTL